jgi:HK97 gp10 family phage protein
MANELEGVAELDAKLRALGKGLSVPILRKAVRAAIKPAQAKASELIPVGTEEHRTYKGRLVTPGFAKRSLRVVTRASEDGRTVSAALGVRKEAFYAALFVELGTSKMRAQPFLRPALESTQDQQQGILADKLREEITKVAQS